MAKVAFYEVQVDDFTRAQKFYGKVMDWEFSKYESPMEYYIIKSKGAKDNDADGGMLQREHTVKKDSGISAFVCTFAVDSIDETLAKVTKHGGAIAMPKTKMEGIGHVAYAVDTEGNTFSLWEK